jgi:hypothetical protein
MENSNTFIFNKFINFNEVIEKYKFLLICIFVIFIIFIILIILLISFIIIKILEISLDRMVFFYDYNKLCKKMLKKYGDCEINKIYLIRRSLTKLYSFLMNIVTLFKYDELVNKSKENLPHHVMILMEVKLKNNEVKWLLVEKNNCMTINDNFIITQGMEVEEIEINKKEEKKIYLKSFLEETRNRIGNENFFNWHIYENNCQEFIKELIITNGNYDDYYKKKIFTNKMIELLQPTEFVYYGFNCIHISYMFLEKYIFEMDLFN